MTNYIEFGHELRQVFGEKVYKISLDSGFTCPTRDGTKGWGGCFYCGDTGSHYVRPSKAQSITDQIQRGKQLLAKKFKVHKFIAYFQSFTSTYGPPDELAEKLEQAVADPDIVGIHIATRPDCLSTPILELLSRYMLDRYHWLEIGLESSHNQTLAAIGRKHSANDFEDSVRRAKKMGFRICAHVILGLPNETEAMQLETMQYLAKLDIDGIKFHNLHIVKNSVFEKWHIQNKIPLYTLDDYKRLLAKCIVQLPPTIVIHRLMGDAPPDILIAPDWVCEKQVAVREIKAYLFTQGLRC